MRHQRGCDCDACYDQLQRKRKRRTHVACLGNCGAWLPKDHDGDYCDACRLEAGEARWCDAGNHVIPVEAKTCPACHKTAPCPHCGRTMPIGDEYVEERCCDTCAEVQP